MDCPYCRMEIPEQAMTLKVKRLGDVQMPYYANEGDAGFDLRITETVRIWAHETVMAGTGIAVAIPSGYVGLVFPRSGVASKQGINLANCVGVVDSGYRGEIKLPLHNDGKRSVILAEGTRCAQMAVIPCMECELVEVEEMDETKRGEGGFGSSGVD